MPSFFPPTSTATSTTGSLSRASMSRIMSHKRSFEEDEPVSPKRPHTSSQSEEIHWPRSPEPVHRSKVLVAYRDASPAPPPFDPTETAADRRRKAILALMSENQPDPIPSTSTGSGSKPAKPKVVATRIPAPQVLPNIPQKDRSMPWDKQYGDMRPARTASASSTNSSTGSRTKVATGGAGGMSISAKLTLSTEQQKVLQLVCAEGKNIFFTGSAGTGKSVLLREIIKGLRKKFINSPDAVAVTASTGIAACNIGGVTLHSFGGVGLGIEKADVLVGKIRKNKKAQARWTRTKVLIIDEVSMVDGDLFDKFCKIGQMIRKSPKPFGGIQIIVTGDFFQLPPVTKGGAAATKFCFDAATWEETISMSVNLTKVFRQKDQRFVDMLNEMRFGRMTSASIQAFSSLSRPIIYDDGIVATELFPRREDVERANSTRLDALNTDGWSYSAVDGGSITDPVQREKLLSNFMAPKHIMLKIDCQVMLIKNLDETLVNGSMGKVIDFVHKQFFDTDIEGKWSPDAWMNDLSEEERAKKIKQRELLESKMTHSKQLPIVRFKVPGGFRDMVIDFDTFKTELPNGEVQASRTQLPLILAWAMSIHKSQGQTLDRVKVDLSKVFEKGQAYVALSRATSLEGLQVLGFNASKVQAHPKVTKWSTKLKDLNDGK